MKFLKYIVPAIIFTVALFCGISCNKASHNGKLDGQWQVMSVEDIASGNVTTPQEPGYFCIYLHIFQLSIISPEGSSRISANMTYDKNGSTLYCDFPYVADKDVESLLGPYGIQSNPITFDITKLDGKSLVLRSDKTLITCRRF